MLLAPINPGREVAPRVRGIAFFLEIFCGGIGLDGAGIGGHRLRRPHCPWHSRVQAACSWFVVVVAWLAWPQTGSARWSRILPSGLPPPGPAVELGKGKSFFSWVFSLIKEHVHGRGGVVADELPPSQRLQFRSDLVPAIAPRLSNNYVIIYIQ